MTGEVYWTGDVPEYCQLTRKLLTHTFIDGKTKMGPWAIMSEDAHAKYGVGLGQGKGQKYQHQRNGKWLKVEG